MDEPDNRADITYVPLSGPGSNDSLDWEENEDLWEQILENIGFHFK